MASVATDVDTAWILAAAPGLATATTKVAAMDRRQKPPHRAIIDQIVCIRTLSTGTLRPIRLFVSGPLFYLLRLRIPADATAIPHDDASSPDGLTI